MRYLNLPATEGNSREIAVVIVATDLLEREHENGFPGCSASRFGRPCAQSIGLTEPRIPAVNLCWAPRYQSYTGIELFAPQDDRWPRSVTAFVRWGSRRLSPRRDLLGRTFMRSISSVRSAGNVLITSSSSTSATCVALCQAIFNIITIPERISRSARTARGPAAYTFS